MKNATPRGCGTISPQNAIESVPPVNVCVACVCDFEVICVLNLTVRGVTDNQLILEA